MSAPRVPRLTALVCCAVFALAPGLVACNHATDAPARPDRSLAAGDQAATLGDKERGAAVFSQNCGTCHGSTGREGGVAPNLVRESERKNYEATIAWIKNPQPPMPRLYPSPLSDEDVADVAAYVQSL